MDEIKVSVTIPVYNTSKYLRCCLDSLSSQTLNPMEFILVDDGSTDDSGNICDEYAKRDRRFRVIHQMNGGSAVARQTGLDAARGEYVIVCDSDDWTDPDMYERLYMAAKNADADMAICGYYVEYPNGKSVPTQTILNSANGYVDNNQMLRYGANSSWVKLIKKRLFESAKAAYTPGINLGEDALIMYKLLSANPRIVQIQTHLYHYRRQYGGVTYTSCLSMSGIKQLQYILSWLKENNWNRQYDDIIRQRALDIAFSCLRTSDCSNKYINEFVKKEIHWHCVAGKKLSIKSLVVVGEKILPIPILRFLVKKFYKYFV